jgi:hypothetical protein
VIALGSVLRRDDDEVASVAIAAVVIVAVLAAIGVMLFAMIFVTVPAAIPLLAAPVGTLPALKTRSIKDGAIGIIEDAFAAVRSARIDAQHFGLSGSRIGLDGIEFHLELPAVAGEILQAAGDIDVAVLIAILRIENYKLTVVSIGSLRGREGSQQKKEPNC